MSSPCLLPTEQALGLKCPQDNSISYQVKLFQINKLSKEGGQYMWRLKSSLDKHLSGLVWAGNILKPAEAPCSPVFQEGCQQPHLPFLLL